MLISENVIILLPILTFSHISLAENKQEQHINPIKNVKYDIEIKIDRIQKGENLSVFVGMVDGETLSPINAQCHLSNIKTRPERPFTINYIAPEVLSKGYDGYVMTLMSGWPDGTLTMEATCTFENKLSILSIHSIMNNAQPKFVTINDVLIPLEKDTVDTKHYISYAFNK